MKSIMFPNTSHPTLKNGQWSMVNGQWSTTTQHPTPNTQRLPPNPSRPTPNTHFPEKSMMTVNLNNLLLRTLVVFAAAAAATPCARAREYAPRVISPYNADAYSMKTFAQ